MPPPSPSATPTKVPESKSSSDSGIIIIVVVVGSLALIATILALFFILRRNSKSQRPRTGHNRNRSDASDFFLLSSEAQTRGNKYSSSGAHPSVPPALLYKRNDSADSLVTMRGLYDDYETPSLSIRPTGPSLPSPPSEKPILSIQPHHLPPVDFPDDQSHTSTPKSAESISLYSQPSATPTRITLSSFPPVPQQSLPPLPPLPPLTNPSRLAKPRHTEDVETSAPVRSDTRVIGKLLKTRAKQRNQRKPTRSISRIERKGSIRPVDDSDDTDEEEDISDRETTSRPTVRGQ
ncbi:hypothetical protein H0H92_015297 [Tricholoma furcatifolium]|nr:hypothetical protein H0H92_015297 [Tricholoma furcatifolium]